ncbi:MAG: DUF5009 domain-containing protein [Armatimonadota bacterium]
MRANRVVALDLLRGIAVLGMLFSGIVPWEGLPGWMYHCQEPPPSHEHNPLNFGITWVDLVFPVFLFCLGAAIPLALGPKLERGIPKESLLWGAFSRYLKLAWFAVFTWQTRPWQLSSSPGLREWGIALIGLLCVLGMFANLPKAWPSQVIRIVSLAASFALFKLAGSAPNKLGDTDYIILILGMCSFVSAAVWIATQNSWKMRLLPWFFVLAVKVGHDYKVPLAETLWNFDPLPNIYGGNLLPYLLLVIPATLVGDWLRTGNDGATHKLVAWVGLFSCLLVTAGLYSRMILPTAVPCLLATIYAYFALKNQGKIAKFGFAMIMLGLATDWVGGGIRKDPNTISYFFIGAGIASLLLYWLMTFSAPKTQPTKGILVCGENPLLAYALITHFAAGAWALTLGPILNNVLTGPYLGLVRAVIQTAVFVAWVCLFRRVGIRLNA